MRRLLLNNQPESRSRAMLKTRRPNAVARILTALFVMLLIPQGLLAGSKPYAFTSTSQTPGETGPSLVNFQTSEGTSWVLSGASSGGGGNLEFTLYKNGTLTSVEEFYKVSKITINVDLTIAQENAPAPYAKFSCNQIQYQIDYFTSQGGDVVLETGDFYPNGPLTIDVEAEDCIVTLYSITVEYDKENWLPNNLTYNGTDPFVINWSGKEGALFPQIGYMDLINPETASEEFCILTDEQLSKIDFSSSDENVAIIDEAGNITILNPGSTTIDANFHGSTRYYGTETWYTLTVNDDREDWNLSYSAPTATVILGTENYELPTLSNAMEPMEYSSSNPSVAEINEEGDVTIKAIGTTVIKAKFLGDDIYKPDSVSYDLTVKAPAPTLAFDPTTATYTFGEAFTKPTLNNPSNVAVTYSSTNTAAATVNGTGDITAVAAGTATIKATYAGDATHEGAEASYILTVKNGVAAVATVPTAKTGLAFTGSAQTLVTAGTATNGTMQYSMDNKTWSNDVPTGTNAGNYIVYYKVKGNANYNDAAGDTIHVTIGKMAAPTLTFNPTAATYTFGEAFAKPTLNNPSNVAVTYSSANTAIATVNASGDITAVAAGETTIKATYAGDDNHTGKETSYILTVKNGAAAVATVPTAKTGLAFTGSAQALVTAGTATNGTMQYSLDNTTWGNDVPTGTNAGNYIVYYKVKGNANYNDAAGDTIHVTIGKMAAPTLTFNPTAATYTFGEAFAKPTLNNPSNVAVTYSSANTAIATVNASGDITAVAAGETTIKATYAGDDNHTGKETSYILTVKNGAAAVATVPTAKTGLAFTGSAQALVTAGTATNGTMQYSLDNKTWGNDVPTGTNAGNYTVYYKVKGNANFNDAAGNSIPVTINKAAGSISYAKTTINKMEGDDTFTNKLTYSGDGAVTYTSKDKTVATVNASGVVTILKAGTTTITATVADGTNYTYATKTATYTLNVERAIVKYDLWIGTTQVTEDNLNNVLGDNDKTFQYFPTVNKLFITNSNGQSIESRINEGLTIYLAPSSNNKLQKIVSTVAAPLTITTDGNYPGGLELETTDGNVIEGFSSLSLEQNLSILKPDNVKYLNNALTASKGIIGIVIETMVEEEKVSLDDQELKDNPLMNYVYNDKVLMTLNNTQDPDGDGWDDSGTPGIVLNSAVSDEVFDLLNMDETAPGTQKFAEIFTGLTILIPGGEGLINIDAETHDGYCIKLKSLFGDELKKEMTTNEERTVQTFNYKFDAPTFVGIYNGGKSGNAARNKMIRPGRKTVTHIKIYNATISPGKVNAANPAGAASGGLYTGPVPAVGQDVENPTEITTGIKDVEHSTFNIEHATGKWYNLNGQQINEPSMKGLYIRNGKKIMIK